jgi:hypothetical protein
MSWSYLHGFPNLSCYYLSSLEVLDLTVHVLFSSVDSVFQKTGHTRKFGLCLRNLMFVQEFQISYGPHLTQRFSTFH